MSTILPDFPRAARFKGKRIHFVDSQDLACFTNTAVNSGAGTVPDDGEGLQLAGAATTDDSGAQIQSTAEAVKLEQNRVYRAVARFRLDTEAVQNDFIFGFCIKDTSLVAGMSDGIYFRKVDGSADLKLVIERDTTETESDVMLTIAPDVWYEIALEITLTGANAGQAIAYIYGTGTVNGYAGKVSAANLPIATEEQLTVSMAFQTGDASGTKTMRCNYIGWEAQAVA
jgi:hypothetical protein